MNSYIVNIYISFEIIYILMLTKNTRRGGRRNKQGGQTIKQGGKNIKHGGNPDSVPNQLYTDFANLLITYNQIAYKHNHDKRNITNTKMPYWHLTLSNEYIPFNNSSEFWEKLME